ncbi:O-antigen ligase family protein [Inconstantimicrobium mannanitabidum]|uniref:Uncharacterized protein n=1 Tax=Inconstantimicrobium mannanitabidum TaxID=1604901 RepID=A0ACB5RGH1_9CLOT|nr:O-antigen ligase family protein [Clostridium sp. TW13]GKX68185.1 hypothetical protein rsdtw13_34430 [Clostridium sp. TW13]
MSKIVLLRLIFIFLGYIFFNKMYHGENKREYIMISLVIITCLNVGINMHYSTHFMRLVQQWYIPLIAVVLAIVFIVNFNLKKSKPTLDTILILIIVISNLVIYAYGNIANQIKFFNICIVYVCIILIGYLYKFLEGYDYIKIVDFFSYIAIANGILAIAQYITNKKLLIGQINSNIFYEQSGVLVKRVVGLAGTSNAAGNLGTILFAVVFFNYLRSREKKHLIALIITSFFSILTLTRIGYLGITLVIITDLLMFYKESLKILKQNKVIIFILLIIAVILVTIFGYKVYNILFLQRGNTQGCRIDQFKLVYKNIIKNNSFFHGIGAGQYQYYIYYFFRYWDIDIHSQYLNLLAENGWVMLIVFISFNICVFIKALKRCSNKLEKSFIIGLFLANLACCNFNPNQDYFINNIMYYLAIYLFVYKTKTEIAYD